jgi:hypothetical protein
MDLTNTFYIIFNVTELSKVNFDAVNEDNTSTVRVSVDETKTFINWFGNDIPTFVNNINSKSIVYNYLDFLQIVNNSEWIEPL